MNATPTRLTGQRFETLEGDEWITAWVVTTFMYGGRPLYILNAAQAGCGERLLARYGTQIFPVTGRTSAASEG